jgi:tetratricopeptide (TPR) repeat protein|tara:strand:+ start:986 stop:2719 length:1734 start_codon:yes stop_codon:yes gene_type:complete
MPKNHIYTLARKWIPVAGLIFITCANFKAYFNTFYNAEEFFEKAEKIRLQNRGEKIPQSAINDYEKVIEKSRLVLDEYPEFKLRKKAFILIVQSHFYRGELRETVGALGEMKDEFGDKVYIEVEFWTSLVKWKQNKPQPAINGLNELINYGLNVDMEAKAYLTIAEIFLEQKMHTEAMDNLEKSAERIQDQNEKGQIYYRIAELSFDAKSYDRALSAYQEVIKNSQSKKQIQEGNLTTVQIYRLKGNLDLAASSIKNMLLDENYKSIYADLELELAKLYDQQNMISESRNRLESIVQDYPKTTVSAEAYYMLGNYSIEQDWDMEDALKQYSSVVKENKQSLYARPAQVRIKEINTYQQSKLDLESWSLRIAESDTIADFYFTEDEQKDLAQILYSIIELEAFHFDRSDTGLVYLDLLIQYAYQSKIFPKALYAKSVILEDKGELSLSKLLKQRIVNEFPKTDFALAIINTDKSYKIMTSTSDEKLLTAERKWNDNPALAMDGYREIVIEDTVSESSVKAAYFLAYQYDHYFVQPDSALKYYEWILKHHSDSYQAEPSGKRAAFLNSVFVDTSEINDY